MGYTNYWDQDKEFTEAEWDAVRAEYAYLLEIAGETITDISEHTEEIVFNGSGPSCETFVLLKKPTESFNFCKTRRLPYDLPVWHLLTFAYHHTNAVTNLSRDWSR